MLFYWHSLLGLQVKTLISVCGLIVPFILYILNCFFLYFLCSVSRIPSLTPCYVCTNTVYSFITNINWLVYITRVICFNLQSIKNWRVDICLYICVNKGILKHKINVIKVQGFGRSAQPHPSNNPNPSNPWMSNDILTNFWPPTCHWILFNDKMGIH